MFKYMRTAVTDQATGSLDTSARRRPTCASSNPACAPGRLLHRRLGVQHHRLAKPPDIVRRRTGKLHKRPSVETALQDPVHELPSRSGTLGAEVCLHRNRRREIPFGC